MHCVTSRLNGSVMRPLTISAKHCINQWTWGAFLFFSHTVKMAGRCCKYACRFSAKSHEICAGLRAGGRVKKCRQLIYRTAILRKLYLGPSYPLINYLDLFEPQVCSA